MRHGVQEVGGAVERVDDPGVGLVGALDHAALFAEEAVAGPRLQQFLEQRLFGLEVGGADIVGRALLGHLQFGHLAEVARQGAAGLAGGVGHHLDQGALRRHGR